MKAFAETLFITWLFLLFMLIMSMFLGVVIPHQVSPQTGVIIPLYSYPGASWNVIVQQKEAHESVPIIVIVNPDSGPGSSKNPDYVNGINNLRVAGITVIGYDHTSYGMRNVSAVEADMNSYRVWYNVTGVFFDEMASSPGYESYYSTLSSYAGSLGLSTTIGNAGTSVAASYIGTVNMIVVYENSGIPNSIPPSITKTAVIAYGVSSIDSSSIGLLEKNTDYVYVTNQGQPNPYSQLPSYFDQFVTYLSE